MPLGPGKYDNLCKKVKEKTNAQGVVLMVIEGSKGNGFSVQCEQKYLIGLPSVLRNIADQIEEDCKRVRCL